MKRARRVPEKPAGNPPVTGVGAQSRKTAAEGDAPGAGDDGERAGGAVGGARGRRGPVFSLTRAEVWRRCRACGRRAICAGQVLALRDAVARRGWSALELAEHSKVSRQMISAILNVARFPTAEVLETLACCLGLKLWQFDLLADFEVRAEVPPWWHGAAGWQ